MKQSLLALLAFCSLALPSRAAVIDPGAFAYRASFTVSGYAGSEQLTNFPVLVRLAADSPTAFEYADCAADGSDIRFADPNGNLIPHESTGITGYGAPYKNGICKIERVDSLDD